MSPSIVRRTHTNRERGVFAFMPRNNYPEMRGGDGNARLRQTLVNYNFTSGSYIVLMKFGASFLSGSERWGTRRLFCSAQFAAPVQSCKLMRSLREFEIIWRLAAFHAQGSPLLAFLMKKTVHFVFLIATFTIALILWRPCPNATQSQGGRSDKITNCVSKSLATACPER